MDKRYHNSGKASWRYFLLPFLLVLVLILHLAGAEPVTMLSDFLAQLIMLPLYLLGVLLLCIIYPPLIGFVMLVCVWVVDFYCMLFKRP